MSNLAVDFVLPLHFNLASSDFRIPCNMKGQAKPYQKIDQETSGRFPVYKLLLLRWPFTSHSTLKQTNSLHENEVISH